jgi:hypothetical protein
VQQYQRPRSTIRPRRHRWEAHGNSAGPVRSHFRPPAWPSGGNHPTPAPGGKIGDLRPALVLLTPTRPDEFFAAVTDATVIGHRPARITGSADCADTSSRDDIDGAAELSEGLVYPQRRPRFTALHTISARRLASIEATPWPFNPRRVHTSHPGENSTSSTCAGKAHTRLTPQISGSRHFFWELRYFGNMGTHGGGPALLPCPRALPPIPPPLAARKPSFLWGHFFFTIWLQINGLPEQLTPATFVNSTRLIAAVVGRKFQRWSSSSSSTLCR